MIRNYITIAWRNLLRYKFISTINLFGLTMGLTCCLLIAAYIHRELSFDKYHKNADNIYRLTRNFYTQDGTLALKLSSVSPPFGHYMPSEFPEFQKMTRLLNFPTIPLMVGEKRFNEAGLFIADEFLFDVFDVEVIKGNPKSALVDPYSIMLSEEMAKKYFGAADPMDKSIRYNSTFDLKVTGIYKSFPSNSHIRPEMLLSFSTLRDNAVYGEEGLRRNWGNNAFLTYVLFPQGHDVQQTINRFPSFIDKHLQMEYAGNQPSKMTTLDLQPLTSIHLHSNLDDEGGRNSDIKRVYIFSAIAIFILLIACINYMNLSTARSSLRAREIGIRKAVGAGKKSLVLQFLSESVLVCWVSLLVATLLTYLLLPFVSRVTGADLSINWLMQPAIIIVYLAAPFITGIISGIYPALFLSSFQPAKTLKSLFTPKGKSVSFRKVLVVSQFGISIILIITTLVVIQQLNFLQKKSLGYDREKLISFNMSVEMANSFEAFRSHIKNESYIVNMSVSSRIPTGRLLDNSGASAPSGDTTVPLSADIKYLVTDYDFADTYGIQMKSGRYFSRDFGADTASFVLNEAAVKVLGWNPENAVGRPLIYGGQRGMVIGVIKDFHFESLHQPISAMIFQFGNSSQAAFGRVSLKLAGGDIASSLASLEQKWKQHFPETPFDYSFIDERYKDLYEAETRQASLFSYFSAIAILIACLGLFGLSAFMISQRKKEIGVRKVLGANVRSIVVLLSIDFLKLVAIAAALAFPIAWFAMNNWLENFAYRVGIAWWIFIAAGVVASLIALITISFLTIRAALSNPVKSLRTE